jgi:hypothetical protein
MACLGSAWDVSCCGATEAPSESIATATSAAVAADAEGPVTPARLLEPGDFRGQMTEVAQQQRRKNDGATTLDPDGESVS